MKLLRHLLFSSIIMICASLTAFAQRQDPPKTPPKQDPPPKIIVKPKPTPTPDRPRDNSRPRRPDGEMTGIFQFIKPIID